MEVSRVQAINDYWFGEIDQETGMPVEGKFELWFGKSDEVDQFLRAHFLDDLEKAKIGEYDHWIESDEGAVALVVLLDQFSRNIFRDSERMYEADDKVLELVKKLVGQKRDLTMPTVHLIFLYMPYMHSEELSDQEACIDLFEKLYQNASKEAQKMLRENIKYAKAHRDVIKTYGRFPHRNKILGRQSTVKELVYLAQPDAGF